MRAGARVLTITGLSAAAVLLTGCGSTSEDPAEWWSAGGENRIQNLVDDVSDVNRARMSPSVVLGEACESLRKHVAEAEEFESIPDDDIQKPWADALASFKRGIPDCVAGVNAQDDALASQGVMEITGDGLRHLKSTASMLRASVDAQ